MRKVKPHELFRLDFEQILEEGKRQEEIDPENIGEFAIVKSLYTFFCTEVLPLIGSNDWVYEATRIFVSDYSNKCFHNLRSSGEEIYQTQQKLIVFKEVIEEFLARAKLAEAVSLEGISKLTKLSDFMKHVDIKKLDKEVQAFAFKLFDQAKDHEEFQLRVILRGIGDSYEVTFTRLMFVVRRALKVKLGKNISKSDAALLEPSNYVDWLESNTDPMLIINRLFVQEKEFYKVSRNVSKHHLGLQWLPQYNEVMLPDRSNKLHVHVDEFHRKFRYLIYFCELGLRGILSAFCERERGPLSNKVVQDYNRTFPEKWTQGEKGIVELYALSDAQNRG